MNRISVLFGVLTVAAAAIVSSLAFAGEANFEPDGSTSWKAGVDGVEIDWNADGSVRRVFSRFGQPVEYGDRRGIYSAQVIAEEKAKAAIVRFMDQVVSSNRVVAEVETDLNKMTQERSGSSKTVRKTDERKLVTSLSEVTGSFAAGKLKGVVVLEKGYDEKSEEAWVVVGISQKTIAAANATQEMLNSTDAKSNANGQTDLKTQPSEIRKSKQKDF